MRTIRALYLLCGVLAALPALKATAQTDVFVAIGAPAAPQVVVLDGATHGVKATIPIPASGSLDLAFTPGGRHLYVATSDAPGPADLVLIDTDPGSPTYLSVIDTVEINVPVGGGVVQAIYALRISPGGDFAYGAAGSFTVVIDLCPGSPTYHQVVATPAVTPGLIGEAAFTADGKELWWPIDGGYGFPTRIAILDTDAASPGFATATEIALPDGFNIQGIDISAAGVAYVSGWGANRIRRIDVASRATLGDVFGGQGFAPRGLALSSDDSRFYVVTDGFMVLRTYDAGSNLFLGDHLFDFAVDRVHFVQLSLDDRLAYVTAHKGNLLQVADVTGTSPVPYLGLTMPGPPARVAVQPVLGEEIRCGAGACIAHPLGVANDFDVFISGDIDQKYTETEGRLAGGGDVRLESYGVGAALPPGFVGDSLIVGGDLDYLRGQVFRGDVLHGGTATLTDVGLLGGVLHAGLPPFDFGGEAGFLTDAAACWAGVAANGTVVVNDWGGPTAEIRMEGSDPELNIFHVSGADLGRAHWVSITAPPGSTVLVNVDGSVNQLRNFSFSLTGVGGDRLILNYFETTHLTISGIGIPGSVLAPYAHVQFDNGAIDGTLIGASLAGQGESRTGLFTGCLPEC